MAPVSTQTYSTPARVSRLRAPQAGLERLGWAVASLATLVLLWHVGAEWAHSRYFPTPAAVFDVLKREALDGQLFTHVGATLLRVVMAFTIAMFIGSVIGMLLGRFKTADRFFDTWLILVLNLPALVTITLSYVWLGMNGTAAVVAVAINQIPNVAVTMREGARSLSRDLAEMAQIYKFGPWRTFRHVILPQLAPFFAAAARSGLALVWKIVLVVEALGGSGRGVGYQIYIAFGSFDVTTILAYALAFIVIVQIIELAILQPIQARVNKWRR
ncbi:MAG: ABC transporter permease [Hyphomicrobiaceae bacterium]